MGTIEVLFSGVRDGEFQLFCISEVEGGRYIVFTLAVNDLVEPFTETNRDAAIETARKFFYDAEGSEGG